MAKRSLPDAPRRPLVGQRRVQDRLVVLAHVGGHDHVREGLSENLVAQEPGDALGLRVEELNDTGLVEPDDDVRCELDRVDVAVLALGERALELRRNACRAERGAAGRRSRRGRSR